jgi:hypothetical protein
MNTTLIVDQLLNATNATSLVDSSLSPPSSSLDKFIEDYIHYFEISLNLIYTIIFVFGILGNSLVIFVLISSICVNANNKLNGKQPNPNLNRRNTSVRLLERHNTHNPGANTSAHLNEIVNNKQVCFRYFFNN